MLAYDSSIAPAVMAARGYWTATAATALHALGFADYQCRTPALVLPMHGVAGHVVMHQIRPDTPRHTRKGKALRYETPVKSTIALDVPPTLHAFLGRPEVPLFVVEGVKKADSLASRSTPEHPVCVIGLSGVWNWRRGGQPLPCWRQIACAQREVIIVFDSDATTTPEVAKARSALAEFLTTQGAQVKQVDLPPLAGGKCGVDDFFVAGHTLADLRALETSTRPAFTIVTAAALYAQDIPPMPWVIPEILPVGATLFSGRGKDGKSLLAWNLCLAVATGGVALGSYRVAQGDVLYLNLEDGERRAQTRLKEQMASLHETIPTERLELVLWDAPRIGAGFEAALMTWIDTHPQRRLVVIDILEKVRPTRTRNGSIYAEDYAALAPLQRLAQDHSIAILIVHHANKTRPEDFRDTASGSTGLLAACDTFWSLQRLAGDADAALHILGRDVEAHELALRFQDGFWTALGNAEAYRRSKTSRTILATLAQAGRPMTPKHLAAALDTPEGTMRKQLTRMHERSEVRNLGDGRYISYALPAALPPGEEEERRERKRYVPATGATAVTGATPATTAMQKQETVSPAAAWHLRGMPYRQGATFVSVENSQGFADVRGSVAGVAPPALEGVIVETAPPPAPPVCTPLALPVAVSTRHSCPACDSPEWCHGATAFRCTRCGYRDETR